VVSLAEDTGHVRKIEPAIVKTAEELGGCTLCKSQGHIRLDGKHNEVYCGFLQKAEKCAPNHEWFPQKYGDKELRDYECRKCCHTLTGLFKVHCSVAGRFMERWRDITWLKISKQPFQKTVYDDNVVIAADDTKYNPWRPNAETMLAAITDPKHAFTLVGLKDSPTSDDVFMRCVVGFSASPIQSQLLGVKFWDLDVKENIRVPLGHLKNAHCNVGAMAAHSWDRSVIVQTCMFLSKPIANFNISLFTGKNSAERKEKRFYRAPIAVFSFTYNDSTANSDKTEICSLNEVDGYIAHVLIIRDSDPMRTPYLIFATVYPTPQGWQKQSVMKNDIIPEPSKKRKSYAPEQIDEDGFAIPASKKPRAA
jgi:hypothetical protein